MKNAFGISVYFPVLLTVVRMYGQVEFVKLSMDLSGVSGALLFLVVSCFNACSACFGIVIYFF
jgi:hypothetical protein